MEDLLQKFEERVKEVKNSNELNDLRIKYLGRSGFVTKLNEELKSMSVEEKREFGKNLNILKQNIITKLEDAHEYIKELELNEKLEKEKIDISLEGINFSEGVTNPLNKIERDLTNFFISLGYDVVLGPEVEEDLYNFEMLNLPKDHPARDAQDSFYIDMNYLLRTHTSPVQAREMLKNEEKAPIRIVCPGKTYRRDDDDQTHSHQFSQIEGLVIDENISLADLKGTLELLVKHIFGDDKEVRFRASFFPFTEPSYEVDVSTNDGEWIEVLGSGMVHPNVLKAGGYDPDKYTGFAFGIGIERIAMLKYDIKDIRDLYTNDIRFIQNFNRIEGDF